MGTKKKDNLKYGEARQRLEEILKEIEYSEVDVDDLAVRVKEAAHLIQVCREKLEKTRLEVEKVVSRMDLGEEGGKAGALSPDREGSGGEDSSHDE